MCVAFALAATQSAALDKRRPEYSAETLSRCVKSFSRLPVTKMGSPIDPAGEEVAHYQKYRKKYAAYDRDCFFGWPDLKPATREFLGDNVGALFNEDEPVPFCAAFRITEDLVMTANHCDIGSDKITLRLFGHPLAPMRLGERIQMSGGASDLGDFAVFRVPDPMVKSRWSLQTFSREVHTRQAILIVASSNITPEALLADDPDDVSEWLGNVRFSRTPSNQIWLASEVAPPVPEGIPRSDCLFHRAPTFAGMSGAPIVAITVPDNAPTKPIFHVIGIHLRSGYLPNGDHSKACGNHFPFNVGIKVPAVVLDEVSKATAAEAVGKAP